MPDHSYQVSDATVELLARAFAELVGAPSEGAVVFCRCLRNDVVSAFAQNASFSIPQWTLFAVTDQTKAEARQISSDNAVELRENKGPPVLLLVDTERAGAGMDGIYSATREITEDLLFDRCRYLAQKRMDRTAFAFAEAAIKRARQVGQGKAVSRWQECEFLASVSTANKSVGQYITLLGLWPIAHDEDLPTTEDLHLSSRLVERLLLGIGEERTPSSRVRSLLLIDAKPQELADLESIVRTVANRSVEDVLTDVVGEKPHLWINRIKPGFLSQHLQGIELKSWRLSSGKVAKWSGLNEGEPLPAFLLAAPDVPTAKQPKLEIRFATFPADLPKGSVEYRVCVRSGEDELAYREVAHQEKPYQTVRLTNDDFDQDLPEDSQFEAQVRVEVLGNEGIDPVVSEEFLVTFGTADPESSASSNARRCRSLVEGAIESADAETYDVDCQDAACYFTDNKGYVGFRPSVARVSYKTIRPPLIASIEQLRDPAKPLGRWSVRVRADGTRVGLPQFHELLPSDVSEGMWDKLTKATQRLVDESGGLGGFWGRIYTGNLKAAEEYVNTWTAAIDEGNPRLALANTIEVQSLSGRTLGLIVLPSHPVRVAWHMAFDQLARHARYEEGMKAIEVRHTIENIDSAHFPAVLPSIADNAGGFVFADTLGFYGVAMVWDQDPEPKAAVAQMMACMGTGDGELIASIGLQASECVAREVSRYIEFHGLHDSPRSVVRVHAVRPGDGSTVLRALGRVVGSVMSDDEEPSQRVRFHLELFPADPQASDVTGSHLRNIAARHRTGAAGIAPEDRWTLQSEVYPGNLLYPRLHWAQRDARLPTTPAHVTVAFDTFKTALEYLPEDALPASTPLHVYGLTAGIQRSFQFDPEVRWQSWHPPTSEGAKHPAGRVLTDRLARVHRATLKAVVRRAGQPSDHWPVLSTTLLPDQQDDLNRVHSLSDWVVTVDRNAGIEFFDSPKSARGVFDAYVIDCVPERTDLGNLQMITSTTKTDEVRELLDAVLATMGLSSSLKNCTFLIEQLKGLSGRLAMRLTTTGKRSGELVALAMVYANCAVAEKTDRCWLPLSEGFFVPVDDVRDLAPGEAISDELEEGPGAVRADLIYVSCMPRGGLTFTFVEVKYRRHLRMARDNQLLDDIANQAESHRRRWNEWFFGESVPELSLAVRRSRLVRALRFYADKASRHCLSQARYDLLVRELDKLLLQGVGYRLGDPAKATLGYVFSPEISQAAPEELMGASSTSSFLFGPSRLPDLIAGVEPPPKADLTQVDESSEAAAPSSDDKIASQGDSESGSGAAVASGEQTVSEGKEAESAENRKVTHVATITLGEDRASRESVSWTVSSRANPHLMIVGLPGMGKTEALLNICNQLIAQSIIPIVFSYHPDIDERFIRSVGQSRLLDHTELGFNPMHIDQPTAHAHIDSAGMLRDIFSAIFTDLGDVQLERVRQALKQAYVRCGWGQATNEPPQTPEFREFYSLLLKDPKPEKNLLARLNELDDYGVFRTDGTVRSLLDSEQPSVIRIHATQNEMVQRATAMLSLYNIYKEMFRRGVQPRITHAVIFDEAHRASRLKLLPTLAVECRKFGLSLILASQSSRDFDTSLFSGIASYLLLRMTEQDAMSLARNITTSDQARRVADRIKQLDKYHALFFREGHRQPSLVGLTPPE